MAIGVWMIQTLITKFLVRRNKMALANEYAKLHINTDLFFSDYKEYDKRKREFISKNSVSLGVFHGSGWSGFSLIFVDGSVCGLSHNLDKSLSYSTHFHDKHFNQ